mmetsp:Transcript_2564/g.6791  ORF Transcript_2564/g.6791 Transcript_2564/m.6791 type:complete len:243 (-) Transcript_2564:122-850(-)
MRRVCEKPGLPPAVVDHRHPSKTSEVADARESSVDVPPMIRVARAVEFAMMTRTHQVASDLVGVPELHHYRGDLESVPKLQKPRVEIVKKHSVVVHDDHVVKRSTLRDEPLLLCVNEVSREQHQVGCGESQAMFAPHDEYLVVCRWNRQRHNGVNHGLQSLCLLAEASDDPKREAHPLLVNEQSLLCRDTRPSLGQDEVQCNPSSCSAVDSEVSELGKPPAVGHTRFQTPHQMHRVTTAVLR